MPSLKMTTLTLNANGFLMQLVLQSLDGNGNLKGKIVDGAITNPIEGFWDEDARKISFIRIFDPANPSTIQVFTGYLMNEKSISGTFEAFAGSGATAQRSVFGWLAFPPPPSIS